MLKPQPIGPIPEATLLIGQALLPEDDLYRIIGEQYAELVKDEDFAGAYSTTGQPAYSPARLSLVTVLQAMEHLSDRATSHMVRTRIDWKYALHLPLTAGGFDPSVLCEFRQRLVAGKAERKFFDALLEKFKEKGLLKGRGLQRTDSLQIVSAVRELNRLELVMETLRLALEALVKTEVEWVKQKVPAAWFEQYGEWIQSERLVKESGPQGKAQTTAWLKQTGQDGFWLLEQLQGEPQLQSLAAVQVLEQVWAQQYRRVESAAGIEITLSTKESRQAEEVDRELISTPHEVEARYSEKRGRGSTGHKLHLTETAGADSPAIITDVEVVGGQEYDGAALPGIHQRLQEREVLPDEHLVDGGYMSGETLAESAERGVKLVGPLQAAKEFPAANEVGQPGQSGEIKAGSEPEQIVLGEPHQIGFGESAKIVLREPGPIVLGEPGPIVLREPGPIVLGEPGEVAESELGQPGLREPIKAGESQPVKAGKPESPRVEPREGVSGAGCGPGSGESRGRGTCLGVKGFQLDFEQRAAICPGGEAAVGWLLTRRNDKGIGGQGKAVVLIRWEKEKCLNCQLAPPSLLSGQRGRLLKLSPHYPEIAARRAEQERAEFWQKYRRRAGIEATLSSVVRGYGGRRTPYRGRGKTGGHYLRVAAAINLKRAIAWEAGNKPKRERVVKMKQLLGMEQTTRKGWARGRA